MADPLLALEYDDGVWFVWSEKQGHIDPISCLAMIHFILPWVPKYSFYVSLKSSPIHCVIS